MGIMENLEQEEKFEEWYTDMKVYYNGSDYIGIPHTKRKGKKRYKIPEKEYIVRAIDGQKQVIACPMLEVVDDDGPTPFDKEYEANVLDFSRKTKFNADMVSQNEHLRGKKLTERKVTRSGEFARLYAESLNLPLKDRKGYLSENMRGFFSSTKNLERYVEGKMSDKKRAALERLDRFKRKANNARFKYFVTFTYDDKKQTEESFREQLLNTLRNFSVRYNWKYIGVWERGGENERLHFHAFLKFPEGAAPGSFQEKKDYDFSIHDMKTIVQNTYFLERFGRNDFSPILDENVEYRKALDYITKYILKSDAKLVCSRGLPMYYKVTTRSEGNVICKTGVGKRKLVLREDFECWTSDGEFLGNFGEELKDKLPHASH